MAHRFPDFTESDYMSFFNPNPDARTVRRMVLNDPTMLKPRYDGWTMDFSIDPQITPHDDNGNAQVRAYMRQIENGVLSDMRAPLGDSLPMEEGNSEFYSAPVAHFTTKHFQETSWTMRKKRELYENLRENYSDVDAQFIASYLEKLQLFVDSANMTITHMGEQLMTRGFIYYDKAAGIKEGIYKADIPAKNFLNACMFKLSGSSEVQTTWADTDALMIDSLNRLVDQVNEGFGVEWNWQFDMPKAIWENYVKKNKQVLESMFFVANPGIILNDAVQASSRVMSFSDEQFLTMLNNRLTRITIKVHDTKQRDENKGVVRGWAAGKVTLRPLGRAGLIRHTGILDAEVLTDDLNNPAITNVFEPTLNGLGYVQNSVWPDGVGKQWRTRLIYSATPTLDEYLYHFILTTGTASDNGNWY
jgi:hypothetical protein